MRTGGPTRFGRSTRHPRWPTFTDVRARASIRLQTTLVASLAATALLLQSTPVSALASQWPEPERAYKSLLDCTRSGGWVNADGTCDTEDAEDRVPSRKPLTRTVPLSAEVARPHARRMARAGYLSHDLGGSVRQRFARAGLADGYFGESIVWAHGDPMAAMVEIHRLFQSEWKSKGWHWKNMTNRRFRKVGIGVWVMDGRTYLAVDFHS
jgi:hypothetical protein